MRHRPASDRLPTDRDLALAALLTAALLVLAALLAVLIVAVVTTTGLTGHGWHWPSPPRWPHLAAGLLTHLDALGTGVDPPWRDGLHSHGALFWTVLATDLGISVTTSVALGRWMWRRWGPTTPGHASRREIRQHLSPSAARGTARWTRADLTDTQRRSAPVAEISVPLHHTLDRRPLVCSLETPTGTIAPTRSGKSRTDLIHKALSAPGALVVSSTKPDLAEWALLARARREGAGPVWLIDTTGTVDWPAQVRWSPVTGCTDPTVALRRATTLIEASAVGLRDVGGNDAIFRGRAGIVLQAYLLAAALHRRSVGDLVAWAITRPPDHEPVELLRPTHPELAENLRAEIGLVAETSDAVWLSVRRALEPFMDPAIRKFTTPAAGTEFDVDRFLADRGTVFLVAGEHQAPQARPILTALVEQILTTAQDRALAQPHRRLEPPVTAILDELYDATPIPRLPAIIADSAGRGVLIHWSAQSRSQLDDLYGEHGRRQLCDNTLTLTIFPGLKDDATLEWLETLAGQHRRRTHQHHHDGMLAPGRSAIGTETVPTYRAGDIRVLPRGRVLILHANLLPILGRTTDVADRPDWTHLNADVHTIRHGPIPITPSGHLHPGTADAAPAGRTTR